MPCRGSFSSFELWQFLSLFFFFMTWTVLRSTGRGFCRTFLNVCLMFFSWLYWGHEFWGRMPQRSTFSSHPINSFHQ